MKIRVQNICKTFKSTAGLFKAVDNVSFEVESGSLVALLGPSGSGKSTILRILAGLDSADSGQVFFGDEAATDVHARARSVGFVFQHYALFRHLTVGENVAFGLDVRGVPKEQARDRVNALLELTSLSGLQHRYPAQLSGGQRQRVALARALAPDPKLLLLDEPFGAIDAKVREELREWIRKLHDEVGVTSIFVTHDQDEAFSVADRVLLIHQGRVEQLGSPTEILDDPETEFVARFVGEVSVFGAQVKDGIATAGALKAKLNEQDHVSYRDGEQVNLVIRSYDLKLWREDPGIATVQRMVTLGDRVRVYAQIDGAGAITAQFPRRSSLLKGVTPGCRVQLEVTTARAYPADASAGRAPELQSSVTSP